MRMRSRWYGRMWKAVAMRKRAEFRNEIKTRVSDQIFERVQAFKDAQAIDSDSAAVARLLEIALFGVLPLAYRKPDKQ